MYIRDYHMNKENFEQGGMLYIPIQDGEKEYLIHIIKDSISK